MFHPIDTNEKVLSVASDIEVYNAQIEWDGTQFPNIQIFWKLSFLSFRSYESVFSQKIKLDLF